MNCLECVMCATAGPFLATYTKREITQLYATKAVQFNVEWSFPPTEACALQFIGALMALIPAEKDTMLVGECNISILSSEGCDHNVVCSTLSASSPPPPPLCSIRLA